MKEDKKKSREKRQKTGDKRHKKSGDKYKEADDCNQCEKVSHYKIYNNKLIGQGSFGKVYRTTDQDTGEELACKVITKERFLRYSAYGDEAYAEEMVKRINTESQFHKMLSGEANIVKLVDTFENNTAYYFFMEYCETDLSKLIKEKGNLEEEEAIKYFTEMVEGYKSIFSNNAFHRDLKPENLLIKDGSIKISDFGFVKIFSELDMEKACRSGKNKVRAESKVGSVKYMAPDVLSLTSQGSVVSTSYNAEKSDIWSMGIILYKMLYGKEPYSAKNEEQMIKVISQKQISFPDTCEVAPQDIRNTNVSSQVKKLLKKMIERDEEKRISFKKLYGKVEDLNRHREKEKKERKKSRDKLKDPLKEKGASNKREELLIFYNKLMVALYHDSVNYASLRQIGVDNYFEVTCKIMTLVHAKRTSYIQNEKYVEQMSEKIKQDISSYHNDFNERITSLAKLDPDQTIESVLKDIYPKIKKYEEPQLATNCVLLLLIDLMLLYSLEIKACQTNFAYIESQHLEKKKKDVMMKHWESTISNIEKKSKGELLHDLEMITKNKKHREREKEEERELQKEKRHRDREHKKEKSKQHKQGKQGKQGKSREKRDRLKE